MDYIILNNDGSLQKQSLTRYINQGSHGVDKIFIGWANGLATDILQVVFTLPNQTTNTMLGEFESNYNYDGEHTINGWIITLTNAQTTYNGLLLASARIIRSGIVQVAYPFTLVINETGVMPDTDSGLTIAQIDSYLLNIQNLVAGAVRQNTDAALSPTSENPVQNKVVTNAIETLKRGSYTKVDTTEYPTLQDFLDSEGEEGYLYLYPVNISDEDEGYYQYIWENDLWIPLGTTKIDIANMVTTDTNQTISGAKTLTSDLTLYADNGDSPSLVFERGTLSDSAYDWKITDVGGELVFKQLTGTENTRVKFGVSGILPSGTYNLGASDTKWNKAYINDIHSDSLSFKRFDAPENTLVFTDEMMTELMSGGIALNGKLYGLNIYNPVLFKGTYTSTNDVWGIIVYSAQANGETQEIAMYRIPQSTKQFSIATYNWVNYKNAKTIDFGNNAKIIKDSSNRIVIQFNNQDVIKVGGVGGQTYCASNFTPETSGLDLGRNTMKWNYVYTNYISDGITNISVGDIVTKIDTNDMIDLGTFDANGEITYDIETLKQDLYYSGYDELHGMFMLTYLYAQAIIYLDETQIATASAAGHPVRAPMPVVYDALNSYSVPGNIRVQKVGTNLVFKVSDGNLNAAQGQHMYLIPTKLVK